MSGFSLPSFETADPSDDDDLQPALSFPDNSNGFSDLFRLPDSIVLYSGDRIQPVIHSGSLGSPSGGAGSADSGSTQVTNTATTGLNINVTYDSSVGNAPAGFTNVVAQVV
jgi:hypothetical protein